MKKLAYNSTFRKLRSWHLIPSDASYNYITSWQIDGEKVETMTDFIFLGSKTTTDGYCSHEIKRHLPLGRKTTKNLDSVLKTRDITLPTKVCIAKVMFFPVVMHWCGTWTIKEAECWRIYAFELWYWRTLLRVPWIARRSNQSILKEINPEYSLEELMLKLQYFGHMRGRVDSLEKSWLIDFYIRKLSAGGEEKDEMVRWYHHVSGHEFEQSPEDSEGRGEPGIQQSVALQSGRHNF